jgi:hypothetical protein
MVPAERGRRGDGCVAPGAAWMAKDVRGLVAGGPREAVRWR